MEEAYTTLENTTLAHTKVPKKAEIFSGFRVREDTAVSPVYVTSLPTTQVTRHRRPSGGKVKHYGKKGHFVESLIKP